MVIGTRQLDDVELMRGKSVPAERIKIGNKVSLFDFSDCNKERLLEWENLDSIMVDPYTYDWHNVSERTRDRKLIDIYHYLNSTK